jgi:GDPmannose 4,6-dehydratase
LKQAIIFGSNGQDGFYLTELLTSLGIGVIRISRNNGDIKGDISNNIFVENIINKYIPDFIFNFAANSSTNHNLLFDNHSSISTGTLNLLEAVRKFVPNAKVFISGSAMQFKNDGNPINEQTPFEASSCYSAERIYSIYLARYFREKFKMKIYVGYLFNHDSPLRRDEHFNQKVIIKIINLLSGENDKLDFGDLSIKKEFGFAGDFVKAIWKLVNQDDIFEAVIGTGITYSFGHWVNICFSLMNLDCRNYIKSENLINAEYKILVSNPYLINSLGWYPETSIDTLAKMMFDYQKNKYNQNL